MTTLLDGNVLIALSDEQHNHHARARARFSKLQDSFATCPSTQGTLLRHVIREGYKARSALAGLARITNLPGHEFWPDSISYHTVQMARIIGYRQVTDAILPSWPGTTAGGSLLWTKGSRRCTVTSLS